ncbi:MAG: prepilin-type N-terminal cleavage/methylation domain-containing protein [bacterium]
MKLGSKKGFTLIELMIVVAIIGILASVAIPKFSDMLEKSREGATKGNVGALKSAISIYYGDNTGAWPSGLADTWFAKYMDRIPAVKVKHPSGGFALSGSSTTITTVNEVTLVTIATDTDGWKYNQASGDLWINNSQTDSKGEGYSVYGY